jgi:hypothetical protein
MPETEFCNAPRARAGADSPTDGCLRAICTRLLSGFGTVGQPQKIRALIHHPFPQAAAGGSFPPGGLP